MRRLAGVLAALLVLMATGTAWAGTATVPPPPSVAAQSVVLMDASDGQVLYAKHPHRQLYPASITKIMTALLALRHGHLDQVVTVSAKAAAVRGSSCYLQAGQQLTMRDLLYGLLLVSGNDCAAAIAQAVGGSTANFVGMMNREAAKLGARGTHFANPDGLPNPQHYTTAYDMALFTRRALADPEFVRVDTTRSFNFPQKSGPPLTFVNQNRLLWNYPGDIGVKIGYTNQAEETIVGAARRQGMTLIAVALHTTPAGIWSDPEQLLSWGFAHFTPAVAVTRGSRVTTSPVRFGREKKVGVLAGATFRYAAPQGGPQVLTRRVRLEPLRAPVRSGQVVGREEFLLNGQPLGEVPLVAGSAVAVLPAPPPLLWGLLALAVGLWTWRSAQLNVRRRRRYRWGRSALGQRWYGDD
ncbi:MAG: D-alanyl-D-alanine carboxypeptidase [Thermaerobacter sp.]|nr:D-alanyl-D-alanine carboxypeptidase [Thermaerobacter sp.]